MVFLDAPHLLPWYYKPQSGCNPPATGGAPRRAWLFTPDQVLGTPDNTEWQVPPDGLNAAQHTRQTEGWDACWALLSHTLATTAFDGLLGFSQGAGIAAAVAAKLERDPLPGVHLRFVILCSGYVPAAPAPTALLGAGTVHVPSLHVVGGADTGISAGASRALFECFGGRREMVGHERGHVIPRQALPQCRAFVLQHGGGGGVID